MNKFNRAKSAVGLSVMLLLCVIFYGFDSYHPVPDKPGENTTPTIAPSILQKEEQLHQPEGAETATQTVDTVRRNGVQAKEDSVQSTEFQAMEEPAQLTSSQLQKDPQPARLSSAKPYSCMNSNASVDEHIAYVNVSVATLWKQPQMQRKVDILSMEQPVRVLEWTRKMSIPDKLWLVGKTETQALLGQAVYTLEERGEWTKAAVINQSTPLLSQGYPGWLPSQQLTKKAGVESGGACPKVVVQAKTAWLYNDPSLTERYRQISFNTVLPLAAEDGDILTVATPADGFKWIDKKDVLIRGGEAGKAVTGQEVSELARQFLGLPYLWAGTSGFGFDCSGFTYSLYGFYGISIPRDAKDQAKFGQKVDPSRLSPGDLLFYAREEGKGAVHHVAMYIGNGQMIHSPKTERSVEMISMNTPEYAVEYAVARRVIP